MTAGTATDTTSSPFVALRGPTGRVGPTGTTCPTCGGPKHSDAALCRPCRLTEWQTVDPAARFWARVDASAGLFECWPWSGSRTAAGYGQLSIGRGQGRMVYAHRLSYELAVGPVPAGMVVRHHCDNPPCVNPAHLVIGAQLDNVRDMVNRGRRRGPSLPGELNPTARLTADAVREIRRGAASGETHRGLAARFGVTKTTVGSVLRGKSWTTVR